MIVRDVFGGVVNETGRTPRLKIDMDTADWRDWELDVGRYLVGRAEFSVAPD